MPWEVLQDPDSSDDLSSGNLAVHAALVVTADGPAIFYFNGVFGAEGARLFFVDDRRVHPKPQEPPLATPGEHVFCSGHALLPDGRLLVGGGVVNQNLPHGNVPEAAGHDSGERRCYLYHPLEGKWEPIADFNFQPDSEDDPRGGGRWYPTLLALATGEVIAVAGHPYAGKLAGKNPDGTNAFDLSGSDDYVFPGDSGQRHNNNTPERYSPATKKWALLTAESTANNNQTQEEYPRIHLAPSGAVFFSTLAKGTTRFYNPYSGKYSSKVVDPPGDSAYLHGSAATSVLLPILDSDLDNVWVLACGGVTPQRINIASSSPQWTSAGNRDTWIDPGAGGNQPSSPVRSHLCAVILPTGDVFVTGGVGAPNGAFPQGTSTRVPEVYTPPIDWDSGKYAAGGGDWSALTNEPATVVRGYHSVALLMPDGAVWTAGSTDAAGGDATQDVVGTDADGNPIMGYAAQNDYRIEVYEPWYFAQQNQRPTVTSVPKNIGYGYPFRFNTQADAVGRVVLTRCGSVTHAFDSDQRLFSVGFTKVNANTLEVVLPITPELLPPGRYLLWVVDKQNRPCKKARFIRVSKQKGLFAVDFDKFAKSEVDALGTPATFNDAVYLVYDGFLPGEVTAPTRSITWKDNGQTVPGVKTVLGPEKYEGGFGNKDVAQRIVYPCAVVFEDDTAFDDIPDDPGFREIVLEAKMGYFTTEVTLSLTKKLNPRMRDGDPHWLSVDLRAFSTRSGSQPFTGGVPNPSTAGEAYQYINDVLDTYKTWNADNPGADHPFDALPTDQESNRLPVYSEDGDDQLYNFAVARVRFRAPEGVEALNVRVFFRLWTTGWTALEYHTDDATGSYPRDGNGASAAPRLGLYGGEVNTIPCFAEPREPKMSDQKDPTNLKKIVGIGADEVHTYYGCWLDFNQDVPLFPLEPAPDDPGPYTTDLRSIQQLMRGLHQCLVAEIHYWPDDEIPSGATPASSDNLAQRNLLLDDAENPGGIGSHLVHHTFQIKPSPFPFPKTEPVATPPSRSAARRLHPDELVIDWGNLPRDSQVTFYLPQLDVDEVLRFAAERQGPGNLARAGDGAITCKVTDVGFIPIPGPFASPIAGLVSVQLPPGLTKGQHFKIVLRQVDGRKLRVIGTTQLDIHVKTATEILPRLERNLSVLKHIALSIPQKSRWYPIFQRYLDELGVRVRAFGADPDDIAPSPTGSGRPGGRPEDHPGLRGHTGKIRELVYDCFGDFEGFVLEDCDRRWVFDSCERSLEEAVRRACLDRVKVTVYVRDRDRSRPLKLVVHCC